MPKKSRINPTLYMTDTLEATLCIIKPNAMQHRSDILRKIIRKGFYILLRKKFQLSPEQAADFYQEYEALRTYMLMVLNLSNGPIEVVLLTKEDAVDQFIGLIGPEKYLHSAQIPDSLLMTFRPSIARCICPGSLRAIYGDCTDDLKNAIHGSLSIEAAKREIHFFFPNFIIDPLSRNDAKRLCCKVPLINPLMTGLQQLAKERPSEPIIWIAKWFLNNNPLRPAIAETTIEECLLKEKLGAPGQQPCPESTKPVKASTISETTTTSMVTSLSLPSSSTVICSCLSGHSSPSSSSENLAKVLCCCKIQVKPGEIAICPACQKIIEYTVPVEASVSKSDSTATSTSTSTDEDKVSTPSATVPPPCAAKPILGTCIPSSSSKSSPFSTESSSSTPSKGDGDDALHEVLRENIVASTE